MPAGLLACISRPARMTCLVLALLTGFGIRILIEPGGHDPRAAVEYLGYCVAVAAFLVEAAAFAIRAARRRRGADAPP